MVKKRLVDGVEKKKIQFSRKILLLSREAGKWEM